LTTEAQDLLAREEQAWDRMWAEVERVPAGDRTLEGVVGDWSVQDMVWHCARWADFCGEHLEIMRGGAWTDPFDSEPDEYWDRMNQDIADASKVMVWDDVTSGATTGRARVRTALAELGAVDEVAEQWFADETFAHYDEHAEHIAAFANGLPA
jgi:DinB family protein